MQLVTLFSWDSVELVSPADESQWPDWPNDRHGCRLCSEELYECMCVCRVGGLCVQSVGRGGEMQAWSPQHGGGWWESRWPPKWQKTCMFSADPYTLTEHFLNLSSVFLRHKQNFLSFSPPFKTLHPPQASCKPSRPPSVHTHLTISTFLLLNKDSMEAVWPVKANNLYDMWGTARSLKRTCWLLYNTPQDAR